MQNSEEKDFGGFLLNKKYQSSFLGFPFIKTKRQQLPTVNQGHAACPTIIQTQPGVESSLKSEKKSLSEHVPFSDYLPTHIVINVIKSPFPIGM